MKKIKIVLLSLTICLVSAGTSFAGTDAAAFLKKNVGTKAIGMGGAFTSIADDTSAIYWNPAGLAKLGEHYSLYAMGSTGASDKYPGLKDVVPSHQFFAISVPAAKFTSLLGKTVFGLGYISSTMDNIQHTYMTGTNSIYRGTMSHTDNAYYLSAGLPIWQSDSALYLGASLKYITYSFSSIGVSDSGIDVDAGAIYTIDTLSFGLLFQKGVKMGEDHAPMTTKLGVSNLFTFNKKLQLTAAGDLVQRQDEPLVINVGAEFGINNVVALGSFGLNGIFLRAGVSEYAIENRYGVASDYNETASYNFGLGFDFNITDYYFKLDIAICSGNIFEENTKFALNFYF
ncbi:MAG: hypothetical protein II816_02785 [Elusimicrobia bacterium]|nr:hypothetical protein [Elusimicrobiota bacterium]